MLSATSLPGLAHGAPADEGGVSGGLLIGALATVVLAVALWRGRQTKSWVPPVVGAIGIGLGIAAFVLPGGAEHSAREHSDAVVRIVEPEDGARVPAGEPVNVEVDLERGELATSATATEGGHLHLFVDGRLIQMPYSTTAEVTFEPGPHAISVEYVDLEHISYDPPIKAEVSVTAR